MLQFWLEDEAKKKELSSALHGLQSQFSPVFEALGKRSRCSVIRTAISEICLTLSNSGLSFDQGWINNNAVEPGGSNDAIEQIALWKPQEEKVQSQLKLRLHHDVTLDSCSKHLR